MNHMEFGEGMEKLKGQWPAAYQPYRVKLFFGKVKHLSKERWLNIVDELISNHRQAPLANEILEVMRGLRPDENVIPIADFRDWNKSADCDYCKDRGVYLCKKKNSGGVWAFRCHCSRGLGDGRTSIPFFTQGHAAEFYYYELKRGNQ